MADVVSSIIALLQAQVADGPRIFGGELPPEEARQTPRPSLVVSASGGVALAPNTFVEVDTQRFDLFAYAGTPAEAAALLDRADRVLRHARRAVWAGLLIHWVQRAGGYSDGRDAQLAWPRAFRSYQVAHSLEPVA